MTKEEKEKIEQEEELAMDETTEAASPIEEEGAIDETISIEELMKASPEGLDTPPAREEEDFKAKYLRQLAETENMRRRLQDEKMQTIGFAIDNIISEFLAPIDQLEKALSFAEQGSDEVKNWAIGFKMILSQFHNVLSAHNIEPFESMGKPFDPELHEAIERVETKDYEEGTVVEEILKGYRKKDRILRHAQVKVATKPAEN